MTLPTEGTSPVGDPAVSAAPRRVLVVADHTPVWEDMARTLRADAVDCVWVPGTATPADVARDLQHSNTALVVDLSPDPVRGMTLVSTCRQNARLSPVVVVASNPSIELARRLRLSGVFYLALDPVSTEEMRSVLASAFGCLARKRPDTSMCRVKRRVLVVDDDADFVASISTLLESQGYCVTSARSGKEGVEKLRSESPDLIVLDVVMEDDSSGYAMNQAVKYSEGFECFRHIPILMVSSIPVAPADRFSMAGEVDMVTPDSYLTKPVDIKAFLDAVKALIGDQSDPEQA
jgi:two-component system alkaline phosphatase synthesis response regulator PhoP